MYFPKKIETPQRFPPVIESSISDAEIDGGIKWKLIKYGLRLGSLTALGQVFNCIDERKTWNDNGDIQAKDFWTLIFARPKEIMEMAFELIPKVLTVNEERHNDAENLLQQLITMSSGLDYQLLVTALNHYEQIITSMIGQFSNITYLRWYEKQLIKEYYLGQRNTNRKTRFGNG